MLDLERLFAGKTFTTDWTSANIEVWQRHLASWRDRDCRILEIGSWEGRSALIFLALLPRGRITCVESFTGSIEHQGDPNLVGLEERFDANLTDEADRVEKMRGRSVPLLDRLVQEGRRFDVIYVDGSHRRDDVLVDAVLSWQLLADGGVMIFDDYLWDADDGLSAGNPGADVPKHAIDAFLALNAGAYTLLHRGYQVLIRRDAQVRPNARCKDGLVYPRTFRNLARFLSKRPLRRPPQDSLSS
ncbi:hypothetical protein RHODGE_RHODGE_03721 [Rhodoplanes serenus]|uniref:Class I SAM-dependent methyltransferase n=1 Tax=Rhodoplanes serenus TaxID=200615 RepID=A0A3S4BI67_9BRAD|nr:class I SAM-dependent methyltransferase [Rhodoplanes serenus]VCU10522.1 hypothetical protein RHODGE_RHODGE_03721 [Rhodoplanes serenus]